MKKSSSDSLYRHSASASKDGKGNVTVSVRVRPDSGGDGASVDGEWMVDGRRSLVSYKGREAGEYLYGKSHRLRSNIAHADREIRQRILRP